MIPGLAENSTTALAPFNVLPHSKAMIVTSVTASMFVFYKLLEMQKAHPETVGVIVVAAAGMFIVGAALVTHAWNVAKDKGIALSDYSRPSVANSHAISIKVERLAQSQREYEGSLEDLEKVRKMYHNELAQLQVRAATLVKQTKENMQQREDRQKLIASVDDEYDKIKGLLLQVSDELTVTVHQEKTKLAQQISSLEATVKKIPGLFPGSTTECSPGV